MNRNTLLSLILTVTMVSMISMPVNAADLASSATLPTKIFKCQQTIIMANYTNVADIVNVDALLTIRGVNVTVPMSTLGGGQYTATFGNDNTTAWGNYSITFRVMTASVYYDNVTATTLFVYTDDCTGTNIQGYQNTSYRSTGFGNYTRLLFTGEKNLMEFTLQPYLDYFGFVIYFLMMFAIVGVIYLKTQSVAAPLMTGFLMVAALVSSALVPTPYKIYILFIMGTAVTVILWRLFKSQ
jgi:hypothetical protein